MFDSDSSKCQNVFGKSETVKADDRNMLNRYQIETVTVFLLKNVLFFMTTNVNVLIAVNLHNQLFVVVTVITF